MKLAKSNQPTNTRNSLRLVLPATYDGAAAAGAGFGVILLVSTLVNPPVVDWQLHVGRSGTAGALRLLPGSVFRRVHHDGTPGALTVASRKKNTLKKKKERTRPQKRAFPRVAVELVQIKKKKGIFMGDAIAGLELARASPLTRTT